MQEDPHDDSGTDSPNRRDVLKSLGVASAVSVSTFTAVGAAEEGSSVEYDQTVIDETLEAHATETVELLADASLLETPSLDGFPTDVHVPMHEQFERGEGTTVLTPDMNGISKATVETATRTNDGTLTLVAEIDEGRSYAIYDPDDTESKYAYDPKLQRLTGGSNASPAAATSDGGIRPDGSVAIGGENEAEKRDATDRSGVSVASHDLSWVPCQQFSTGEWQGEDCHRCTDRPCSDAHYGLSDGYIKRETSCATRFDWSCYDHNTCKCASPGPDDPA
ncbi:hypothetical protein [Natrinema sp. 74]|uniref:hypothetical protein n=1 Tax=Natrinema sp. 74 TaxID=3384159 RepID=UPI0038D36BA5